MLFQPCLGRVDKIEWLQMMIVYKLSNIISSEIIILKLEHSQLIKKVEEIAHKEAAKLGVKLENGLRSISFWPFH